ncbi:DUF448 domain-containing protein [Sphingorhabdus sp. Alg239-R122]|uniref:DUF448 domain-containing protein n=1 Tax=Sphingorhabdus sp. Alg239-R122 TaxID=2305989 RepID=UPI001F073406|nr:DUF448 domain-containing protein [Sphingorhabdus sp. Alg239-R122]
MRKPPNDTSNDPVRRCILSGATAPRDELIRLALGPEGQVAPDVRAAAQGRGAWIGVARTELEDAVAKGRLKGALARAFKGEATDIPADLPALIDTALERAFLDRLGLEARSGKLFTGFDKINVAARQGQVYLLMHAGDASEDGNRKLDQAWRMGNDAEGSNLRGLVLPIDRSPLSVALGRENVVHLAVTDRAAASRIGTIAIRLARYRAGNIHETGFMAGVLDEKNGVGTTVGEDHVIPAIQEEVMKG